MNREHYHSIFPTLKDTVDTLFDSFEPRLHKADKAASLIVGQEVHPDLLVYAEVADSLITGEWGGHPRDRIALYPAELED